MVEVLTVHGFGGRGEGIVEVEGKNIFVPFSAPGDKVSIDISGKSPSIIEIDPISSLRVIPLCQHFTVCGGCSLQHLSDSAYADFKRQSVVHCLEKTGVVYDEILPLQSIPPHSRRRASFKVRKEGAVVRMGYHQRQGHAIIDLLMCPLLKHDIVDLLQPLREILGGFLSANQGGDVHVLSTSSGIDLVLNLPKLAKISLTQLEDLSDFAKTQKLARLILNDELIVQFQEPMVVFSGVPVAVQARQFLQVSAEADVFLMQAVVKYLPQNVGKAADLFSGRGTFSFLLAQYAVVDAFEMDEPANAALKRAAQKNMKQINVFHRNLFANPLMPDTLSSYDVIVLDPPRAGALAQAKQIASSACPCVIYISCHPATFARDAQIFINGGYVLASITPIDQFLWTEHVELVAVFRR